MTGFYLVCFDVRDDRRLRKIANELENFGQRVQRSVFECHLEPTQLQTLHQRLAEWLDPSEDQVRYYPLCGKDREQVVIDGGGHLSVDADFHLL